MAKKKQIIPARPIDADRFGRAHKFVCPPVDIIIPYHGQYPKVTKLVDSILTYTSDYPYLITLVDDGSPGVEFARSINNPRLLDGAARMLEANNAGKAVPLVRAVRTKDLEDKNGNTRPNQCGFGAALNLGLKATEHPLVLFMHSDCEIMTRKWLLYLVDALDNLKGRGVKMVSARSDNPGECKRLKCNKDQVGAGSRDEILEGDVCKGYLPFYCVLSNRELFNRIGTIKEYPYHWYEDLEFAHRMRLCGFFQGVAGRAWVKHHGGSTVNAILSKQPKIQDIMDANRDRCIADMNSAREAKVAAQKNGRKQ